MSHCRIVTDVAKKGSAFHNELPKKSTTNNNDKTQNKYLCASNYKIAT